MYARYTQQITDPMDNLSRIVDTVTVSRNAGNIQRMLVFLTSKLGKNEKINIFGEQNDKIQINSKGKNKNICSYNVNLNYNL